MLRLGVTGARTLTALQELKMFSVIDMINPEAMCSGGCTGADTVAKNTANTLNIPFFEYLPYKPETEFYYYRNRQIVDNSDHVVAFWNGHQGGTSYTFKYAIKKLGREKVTIYKWLETDDFADWVEYRGDGFS